MESGALNFLKAISKQKDKTMKTTEIKILRTEKFQIGFEPLPTDLIMKVSDEVDIDDEDDVEQSITDALFNTYYIEFDGFEHKVICKEQRHVEVNNVYWLAEPLD